MSTSTFFISKAAVRNLKGFAEQRVKGVLSSHLSEGIAAALGFKTNAALLAGLSGRSTLEVSKPSNAKMRQRLRAFGYALRDDLRLVPEFEHSYSPWRNYPLRRRGGLRWMAWRNLIVAAVNCGIERRFFGLSPGENWWPGAASKYEECGRLVYRLMIDGNLSAVVSVDAISGDELQVCVVVNPRDANHVPAHFSDLDDGDAAAYAWIERRLGAWIHDGGADFSSRRALLPRLSALTIAPCGYSEQGPFIA